MPELPEVETVRRGLADTILRRRIEEVRVTGLRTVRRTSPEAVLDGLLGTTPIAVWRRGKYIVVELDSGEAVMIHLRMTGQLLFVPAGLDPPLHTHVSLTLSGHPRRQLWFVDSRTFGEVVVFDPGHADELVPELGRLGVDPVAEPFDLATLTAIVRGRSRRMKPLLLDQHVIAGIGNIYADEILHTAKIHPDTISSRLARPAIRRLHSAIVNVLEAAINARGSTLPDARYVDLMGKAGRYQSHHLVYGRAGLRCLTCGRGILRRIESGGRSTVYCPVCQRMPA